MSMTREQRSLLADLRDMHNDCATEGAAHVYECTYTKPGEQPITLKIVATAPYFADYDAREQYRQAVRNTSAVPRNLDGWTAEVKDMDQQKEQGNVST